MTAQLDEESIGFDLSTEDGVESFTAHKLHQQLIPAANRMKKAKEILSKGKLFGVQQEEGAAALQLQAKCSGSGSEVYAVTAAFASRQADNDWAELGCTCPARGREEVCKHGVALLLWRIQQGVGLPQAPMTLAAAAAAVAAPERAPLLGVQAARSRKLPAFMSKKQGEPQGVAAPAKAAKGNSRKPAAPPVGAEQPAAKRARAAAAAKPGQAKAAEPGAGSGLEKQRMSGPDMLNTTDEDLLAACNRVLGAKEAQPQRQRGGQQNQKQKAHQKQRQKPQQQPQQQQQQQQGQSYAVQKAAAGMQAGEASRAVAKAAGQGGSSSQMAELRPQAAAAAAAAPETRGPLAAPPGKAEQLPQPALAAADLPSEPAPAPALPTIQHALLWSFDAIFNPTAASEAPAPPVPLQPNIAAAAPAGAPAPTTAATMPTAAAAGPTQPAPSLLDLICGPAAAPSQQAPVEGRPAAAAVTGPGVAVGMGSAAQQLDSQGGGSGQEFGSQAASQQGRLSLRQRMAKLSQNY